VLHHMMCAYVGPQYDFPASDAGYTCPKCRRDIVSGDPACEIVGTSARCVQCRKEMIVSPPARSPWARVDRARSGRTRVEATTRSARIAGREGL